MKRTEHPACQRCGDPTPLSLAVSGGAKRDVQQAPICGPCQLQWLKVRDAAVSAAFERFLAKKERA